MESERREWPHSDQDLMSIMSGENSRPSPTKSVGSASNGFSGIKAILKMPRENLVASLRKECLEEHKFIQQNNKSKTLPRDQPLYKPSEFATNFLALHDIHPLRKRSPKFPRAQYYCQICEYHCDTVEICMSHIRESRHSKLAKKQELKTTLSHLPKPNKKQLETLDNLLIKIEKEVGLSDSALANRQAIASRVNELMAVTIPGSVVRLYGSSMTGFGLIDSGMNLEMQIPTGFPPHEALIKAWQALILKAEIFSNVSPDFLAEYPTVGFMVFGVKCELSLSNHRAYQTSALLRDYAKLDSRVRTLGTALRFWATLCRLDRAVEGSLPSHAFPLLLIHYLQQLDEPILPCIHDYLESVDVDTYTTPVEKLSKWQTKNTMGLAELWIGFFKYYSQGIDTVISVRMKACVLKENKKWSSSKLPLEDPFSNKRSLSSSVHSLKMVDFIFDCFKIAYLYFGTIQTTLGPIVTRIIVPSKRRESSKKKDETDTASDILSQLKIGDNEGGRSMPKAAITLEELEESFKKDESEEDSEDLPLPGETFEAYAQRIGTELTPKQAQRITELVPKNMIVFKFDGDILTAGQSPILSCTVCGNEGHLQSNCPEEKLPPLRELPRLDRDFQDLLDAVCIDVKRSRAPSVKEISQRQSLVEDLAKFIKITYPNAVLTVFGSSVNGFSFSKSDLDISLTFTDHETAEDLDAIAIIESVAEKLQSKPYIFNVQAITSAKVPIVKFSDKSLRVDCDISLYNILALENTKMLRTYASIDTRVKVLGYVVKEFAKRCNIGDASRGSLSSYAYILMLIYYLQRVSPPVIPVLQEMYDVNQPRPVNMVDGWDAWFYADLAELPKKWPGLGKNKMSVSELWIGFLNFYAVEFDDLRTVVSIRQSKPLPKFEKMWNSRCIAIEDPFDLSHNLGAGISRRMNLYIKQALRRTRDLFGFPSMRAPLQGSLSMLKSYYFDPELMTDGSPVPNDRGCRVCGKIGHIARECPKKKSITDHKKQQKANAAKAPKKSSPLADEPVNNSNSNPKKAATAVNNPKIDEPKREGPDLIALLQSGGIFQQQQQQQVQSMQGNSSFPALPNSAISVEDLERNLVAEPKSQMMTPPPGFAHHQRDSPSAIRDPFTTFRNETTSSPDTVFRGFMNMQQNLPWPQSGLELSFGGGGLLPPPPLAFNSFGIGAGILPGLGQGMIHTPPPFGPNPFGQVPQLDRLNHNPFGQLPTQEHPPPPQDRPLQLNQLPGFNIFGGPNALFDRNPTQLTEPRRNADTTGNNEPPPPPNFPGFEFDG